MKTILVVDDFKTQRNVTKSYLSDLECTIQEAENGELGKKAVDQKAFDLIITDFEMPECDGLELAKHARESVLNKNTPIIMITSLHASQTKARWAGINAWIHKPFEKQDLITAIKSLCNSQVKKNTQKVLLLCESIFKAEVFVKIMSKASMNVAHATQSLEAWNKLRVEEFDALLLDLSSNLTQVDVLIKKIQSTPQLSHLKLIGLAQNPTNEQYAQQLQMKTVIQASNGLAKLDEQLKNALM